MVLETVYICTYLGTFKVYNQFISTNDKRIASNIVSVYRGCFDLVAAVVRGKHDHVTTGVPTSSSGNPFKENSRGVMGTGRLPLIKFRQV